MSTDSRPFPNSGPVRRLAGFFLLLLVAAMGNGNAAFNTVVIDAGHGGHDLGGICGNIIPEKDVALDVATRLQTLLKMTHLKTVMTRTTDKFISLDRRVAIANSQKDAIFISIHFNAAPRRGACGIETFYSSARGISLARRIQQCAMKTTPAVDRGTKPAKFYVLRKTKPTAVLVECGFLTNPDDARLASKKDYRQKLAEQIATAILEYRRSL